MTPFISAMDFVRLPEAWPSLTFWGLALPSVARLPVSSARSINPHKAEFLPPLPDGAFAAHLPCPGSPRLKC